jgi:hypothetical protein
VTTFTEFFCDYSVGSNLNSGQNDHSSPSPRLTYAAGSWVASTGVFTVASGNPLSDGVVVGDFASVYATAATVTGFVGRVTARTSTTITVSLTVKAGTTPTDGTGTREVRIGGCWKGPNAAEDFPFGFVTSTLNDTTNLIPRVNFHSPTTFAVTAAISHIPTDNGPVFFQGYTTTPGDGGVAKIFGPTTGTAFTILTLGNSACRRMWLQDFWFSQNGNSSQIVAVHLSSVMGCLRRVTVSGVRGAGFSASGNGAHLIECWASTCDQSATGTIGAIVLPGNAIAHRCVVFNNSCSGLYTGTTGAYNSTFSHCIAFDNDFDGLRHRGQPGLNGVSVFCLNGDLVNNGLSGVHMEGTLGANFVYVENTNILLNTTDITMAGGSYYELLRMVNCGLFAALDTAIASGLVVEEDSVVYADWPYEDIGDYDFTASGGAVGAGRGNFHPSFPTESYPDLGAAQSSHMDVQTRRPNALIRR